MDTRERPLAQAVRGPWFAMEHFDRQQRKGAMDESSLPDDGGDHPPDREDRDGKRQCTAAFPLVVIPDSSAVLIDQLFTDIKAQTEAAPGRLQRILRLVKALKNVVRLFWCNPASAVGHGNTDKSRVFLQDMRPHRDGGLRR